MPCVKGESGIRMRGLIFPCGWPNLSYHKTVRTKWKVAKILSKLYVAYIILLLSVYYNKWTLTRIHHPTICVHYNWQRILKSKSAFYVHPSISLNVSATAHKEGIWYHCSMHKCASFIPVFQYASVVRFLSQLVMTSGFLPIVIMPIADCCLNLLLVCVTYIPVS